MKKRGSRDLGLGLVQNTMSMNALLVPSLHRQAVGKEWRVFCFTSTDKSEVSQRSATSADSTRDI